MCAVLICFKVSGDGAVVESELPGALAVCRPPATADHIPPLARLHAAPAARPGACQRTVSLSASLEPRKERLDLASCPSPERRRRAWHHAPSPERRGRTWHHAPSPERRGRTWHHAPSPERRGRTWHHAPSPALMGHMGHTSWASGVWQTWQTEVCSEDMRELHPASVWPTSACSMRRGAQVLAGAKRARHAEAMR